MVRTLDKQPLQYTGEQQPPRGKNENGRVAMPYLPDPALVEAVNLSIFLERPLLVKGEPGCGKTQLAWSMKHELGLPMEEWYIKSTSRARDGLYTYDTVGRLRDAQLANQNIDSDAKSRAQNPHAYVRMGSLGKAFENHSRTIVLIDEIDKADIDFPNDLLLELDEKRFFIEETREEIRAKHSPIVLITSNDERDLPDAFLRRCLFHYIEFPGGDRLSQIVRTIFPEAPPELVEEAVTTFLNLREQMGRSAGKKVSTSELIDWFRVLYQFPKSEPLNKLDGKIPFSGVLLKRWDQHLTYIKSLSD